MCVLVEVYNDNIVESTEEITVCLPDLNLTNFDVMLITESEPKCATIQVIDDDVIIGFTNSSAIIREGTNSPPLCVKVLEGRLLMDVNLTLDAIPSIHGN